MNTATPGQGIGWKQYRCNGSQEQKHSEVFFRFDRWKRLLIDCSGTLR
jgi:hypothetical protein